MRSDPRGNISRPAVVSLITVITVVFAAAFLAPAEAFAQRNCGAEGQRPCKVWERIPSCNKGLRENFGLNMCVGPNTTVDARTGKHIPPRVMTTVRMCNRSSRPTIYAAMATYGDPQSGWWSFGWFKIAAGQCSNEQIDHNYTGAVYIYASAPDGTEWDSPDARFCVKTYEGFEIERADELQCRSRDYSIVGMKRFDVKPGVNTFNFGN